MIRDTSAYDKDTIKSSNVALPGRVNLKTTSLRLDIPGFRQDSVSVVSHTLIFKMSSTSHGSHCPACGLYSRHHHGSYVRHLQSLELCNYACELHLKILKFRCRNSQCKCSVFSESPDHIATRYARNTLDVHERIQTVSLKTTSRIASDLLRGQNISCSPSTCLRSMLKTDTAAPPPPSPVYVGLDDFAQKKGHIYMSIVVDQLTRELIEVLPCREGKELDAYLLSNPQIQYVTRDRGRCFIEALNRCLPHATQISDRFHLMRNMTDVMAEEFSCLARMTVRKLAYSFPSQEECRRKMMDDLLELGGEKHREELKLFIAAEDAHRKGVSIQEIARNEKVHPMKIWRLVHNHKRRDYMSEEQKQILKQIDRLSIEISRGYYDLGKLKERMKGVLDDKTLSRATMGIRRMIKMQKDDILAHNRQIAERKRRSHMSLTNIRSFILTGTTTVPGLKTLLEKEEFRQVMRLCLQFRDMIRGNAAPVALQKWIKRARECESEAMRKFAKGIELDKEAVQAAIDIYMNNGILEGTVNKIKGIKRQMFNRAGPKVLKAKLMAFKT